MNTIEKLQAAQADLIANKQRSQAENTALAHVNAAIERLTANAVPVAPTPAAAPTASDKTPAK